jgi:hypothetical protein
VVLTTALAALAAGYLAARPDSGVLYLPETLRGYAAAAGRANARQLETGFCTPTGLPAMGFRVL